MNRRALLGGALSVAVGRALNVVATTQEQEQAQETGPPVVGGTPRVALADVPLTLDAARTEQLAAWWVAQQMFDPPLRESPRGGVVAGLVLDALPAVDGSAYTLPLRPGVRFHDGQPLRARDVAASLERVRDPATGGINGWRLEHIAAVEAPDERTVVLRLARPNVALPVLLASPVMGILPERAIAAGDPFTVERPPVGTGPFAFVAWGERGELSLVRTPAYWQPGLPFLDGIQFQYLVEDTARSTAMVTGAVDVIQSAPLLDVAILADDTGVGLIGGVSRRVCGLVLNLRGGALADVRLRRLVARSIDREALVAAATGGQATAQATLFPDDHWAHLAVPIPAPDTAAVLADLAALGYPAGLRLSLICPEQDPSLANAAVLLQEQFARAGIAATLELLDARGLSEAVTASAFDLLIGYRGPWLDPHELVRPLVASDGVNNLSGYANSAVDGQIAAAVAPADLETRAERYRAIQELLLIDVPWITLFLPNHYHAMTAQITGMPAYPTGSLHGLRRAWRVRAAPDDAAGD